jgi:hypothetical protein
MVAISLIVRYDVEKLEEVEQRDEWPCQTPFLMR